MDRIPPLRLGDGKLRWRGVLLIRRGGRGSRGARRCGGRAVVVPAVGLLMREGRSGGGAVGSVELSTAVVVVCERLLVGRLTVA